jgi:hypothetical protein
VHLKRIQIGQRLELLVMQEWLMLAQRCTQSQRGCGFVCQAQYANGDDQTRTFKGAVAGLKASFLSATRHRCGLLNMSTSQPALRCLLMQGGVYKDKSSSVSIRLLQTQQETAEIANKYRSLAKC